MKQCIIPLITLMCTTVWAQMPQEHQMNAPNDWTKEIAKETFREKLERFKRTGFRVAVIFSVNDSVYAPDIDETLKGQGIGRLAPNPDTDKFLFESQSNFEQVPKIILNKLSDTFDADLFVIVNEDEIPITQNGYERDYWSSKYRAVMTMRLYAKINGSYGARDSQDRTMMNATFFLNGSVVALEYFTKKGKQRSKTIAGPVDVKGYSSEKFQETYESGQHPTTLSEIDDLLERKKGTDLFAATEPAILESIDKLIQKLAK